MNKLRNLYKRALRENESNDKRVKANSAESEYFKRRRGYKKLQQKEEKILGKEKTELKNMKSNDPKQFWRKLMFEKQKFKKYIHTV